VVAARMTPKQKPAKASDAANNKAIAQMIMEGS
jgi:hypothetical protein